MAERWAGLQRIAFGNYGLKPREFYEMTHREFIAFAEARAEAEERRGYDQLYTTAWQTALLLSVHRKKGARRIKPEDLVKFPNWFLQEKHRTTSQDYGRVRFKSGDEKRAELARLKEELDAKD